MKKTGLAALIIGLTISVLGGRSIGQKLSVDEIRSKSLDSIGTADVRGKLRSLAELGEVTAEKLKRSGLPPTTGKAAFGSEGQEVLFNIGFPTEIYPEEKVTFDGHSVSVAAIRPGLRSVLGDYLFRYSEIVRQGLFEGALSTGWLLSTSGDIQGKFYSEGTKKIDGREVYGIGFESKKLPDMRIHLYFDKESFHHVRTEYSVTVAPIMATNPIATAEQWTGHEEMTEDFGDFQTEKGLTLPRSYKISLHIETSSSQADYQFRFAFKQFLYNADLDPHTFQQ